MSYQSLYRRYRPQRFGDVLAQDHVTTALRNAVRTGKVAHAYLFSGPRGCGKTTSARILAKALNCTDLQDGEPCGVCASCELVASGASMDVIEMDAASNNGVDAMRDLVSRAALGTSGRRKVYIVDEVHMLSTAASNALLKTLEEPPDHVVFVLATTDPQKVLPTIRSRTQHFEIRLFPFPTLLQLVHSVSQQAGLELDDATLEAVARRGNGSARDALSALDQVAAAGGIDDTFDLTELLSALAHRDHVGLLQGIDNAVSRGRESRQLARDLSDALREVFLQQMGLPRPLANADVAQAMSPAMTTRSLEVLGETLVAMRDALDPRVLLETALVRVAHPDLDTSPAAIVERLSKIERALASGSIAVTAAATGAPATGAPASSPAPAPVASVPAAPDPGAGAATPPAPPVAAGQVVPSVLPATAPPSLSGLPTLRAPASESTGPAPVRRGGAADAARARLGSSTGPGRGPSADKTALSAPSRPAGAPSGASPASGPAALPATAEDAAPAARSTDLSGAGREQILDRLERRAKVVLSAGRFLTTDGDRLTYGLPNPMHLSRCVEWTDAMTSATSEQLGRTVVVELVVDDDAANPGFGPEPTDDAASNRRAAPPAPQARNSPEQRAREEDEIDVSELVDAHDVAGSTLEQLTEVFPGAVVSEAPPAPPR